MGREGQLNGFFGGFGSGRCHLHMEAPTFIHKAQFCEPDLFGIFVWGWWKRDNFLCPPQKLTWPLKIGLFQKESNLPTTQFSGVMLILVTSLYSKSSWFQSRAFQGTKAQIMTTKATVRYHPFFLKSEKTISNMHTFVLFNLGENEQAKLSTVRSDQPVPGESLYNWSLIAFSIHSAQISHQNNPDLRTSATMELVQRRLMMSGCRLNSS